MILLSVGFCFESVEKSALDGFFLLAANEVPPPGVWGWVSIDFPLVMLCMLACLLALHFLGGKYSLLLVEARYYTCIAMIEICMYLNI